MEETSRSKGTTKSERYLAQLADRTFLNLWAYPNVYRDGLVHGRRAGKELCDLLVVCGDQVIIFSDKTIAWPKNDDVNLAWSRWYAKAVKKSVLQVRGAERWINQNPDRLFLDSACTKVLPIKIPPRNTRKVHGVVVALGAHEACSNFFGGDSGSFMIHPSLQGEEHTNLTSADYFPFTVGDVEPSGSFIHVVNEVTLDILMKELDTVTDFVDYLEHKAVFARSGNLFHAPGEEELLAHYLTHMDNDRHGFVHPEDRQWMPEDKFQLSTGHYVGLTEHPQFIRKKEADKNSYVWDHLIEAFTNPMLEGTTIVPDGRPDNIAQIEVGVRYMAQEPRIIRRLYGEAILEVLQVANQHDRYFRCMLPSQENPRHGIGYVFMTYALPREELDCSYEQYCQARAHTLYAYCMEMLKRCRWVKRIIGIATEPPPISGGASDTSKDMGMVEQPTEWTPKREIEIDELCRQLDILQEDRLHFTPIGLDEYPRGAS